ncbi:hypothetical protein B0H17DRAFT_285568 [Mycena rosella]|uniref:Secreted protein n=1 Tax=Mycena rosella TaxID=1033263 RepID=A0AAD7G6Y7_MYCRO|nr:hypothetical protein B0H17DRAFT_285568 [Mycena rosella]
MITMCLWKCRASSANLCALCIFFGLMQRGNSCVDLTSRIWSVNLYITSFDLRLLKPGETLLELLPCLVDIVPALVQLSHQRVVHGGGDHLHACFVAGHAGGQARGVFRRSHRGGGVEDRAVHTN